MSAAHSSVEAQAGDYAYGNGRDNSSADNRKNGASAPSPAIIHWFVNMIKGKSGEGPTLREAIEEYIEDSDGKGETITSIAAHERALITNVLRVRDKTVLDVMIPRADIAAIDINTSQADLLSLLADKQFSRLPVYRETLDNVVGSIHIKDIMSCLARGAPIEIEALVREVPIVSPSMHVLDLLLMMKQMRKHMVLVVDEFGGIDGLATIGDVVEAIVGEVEDEYDQTEQPQLLENPQDGTITADGRVDIEEFEDRYGMILTEEEREDIDTLGGLVFALAGRVPARGEILTHPSGMVFEIVEADPRRVSKIMIRNLPGPDQT